MAIQDPNFWKRFSTAVHNSDLAKDGHPDLKHSYVPSAPSSAPMSPTSQSHLFSPAASVSNLRVVSCPPPALLGTRSDSANGLRREEVWQAEFDTQRREKHEMEERSSSRPRPVRQPSKLKKSASRASTRPLLSHRRQSSSIHFASSSHNTPTLKQTTISQTSLPRPNSILHSLRSPSSLSLSGRPRTLFKTWTTITGNAAAHSNSNTDGGYNSDSWLESQQRKKRQRTWICWCFWLGLIALVAGVVVAILVLRKYDILKF
jgi:hypothetical protein